MPDEINFTDCCRLILEQGPPVNHIVAPDEPNYRRDLLYLLNQEFAIDWQDSEKRQDQKLVWGDDGFPSATGVPAIAASFVSCYGQKIDPFAGWFEYTPVDGEFKVWGAHRDGMYEAEKAWRERVVAFFRDLLLLHWPHAEHRTTSWSKLQARGLVVPVYDPDDF